MGKAHSLENGTICAADLAEMLGHHRGAAFNIIRILDGRESQYIAEGGNKIARHKLRNNWVIDKNEAEKFVTWYLESTTKEEQTGASKDYLDWVEEQKKTVIAEMRGRGISDKVLQMAKVLE